MGTLGYIYVSVWKEEGYVQKHFHNKDSDTRIFANL